MSVVVGDASGYSNESSYGVGVVNLEGYTMVESLGSDGGAEISYSGGISGGEVAGNIEGYPLGGSSDGM